MNLEKQVGTTGKQQRRQQTLVEQLYEMGFIPNVVPAYTLMWAGEDL